MKLTHAADLLKRSYGNGLGNLVRKSHNKSGVQAFMLNDGTLVIPGTNEASDWRRNLNLGKGSSGRIWHQGFLEHAQSVMAFAQPLRPKLVLGHSLGAASAQIVAVSLEIPAICFASPQPLRGRRWFRGEHRVINVCRHDDAVSKLPPSFLRWRHVGKTHRISPGEQQSAGSHSMADYIRVLDKRSTPPLPDAWG